MSAGGASEFDDAYDRIVELVRWVRHDPLCPIGMKVEGGACTCGLDLMIEELRKDYRLDVVRCSGCGAHAENGNGTEDWAWRPGVEVEPFCNSCAVALMP